VKVLCKTGFLQEELDNFLIPEDEVIEMITPGIDITECGLLVLGQGGTHAFIATLADWMDLSRPLSIFARRVAHDDMVSFASFQSI
jgi:hypothetical protein